MNIENTSKHDARSIVDSLFDNKYFRGDITRDEMDSLENLVAFCLQSRFEQYSKAHEIMEKWESKKTKTIPYQ